jgi:signal transduction histidine kinase
MVEDNGQGIKPEYQPRVFEMFYRANESSGGTGLGLFLVKKIIDQLNGIIRVESTFRMGTTVEIILSAQTEPAGGSEVNAAK